MDMSKIELQHYIRTIRSRYKQSGRKKKGRILDEFCSTHGVSRKHAMRLLNESIDKPKARKRGPKPIYEPTQILPALKEIWLASGQMCGKRLKPVLPLWLPIQLKGFDCDNGSEFLNYHLLRYFQDDKRSKSIQFTRSRPYHSQDNAHVEQKNWTHVRELLGYQRFDKPVLVEMVHAIYKHEASLLNNFFKPTFKLKDKIRIGSKTKKVYELPKTPYQRLNDSGQLSKETEDELRAQFLQLNPLN